MKLTNKNKWCKEKQIDKKSGNKDKTMIECLRNKIKRDRMNGIKEKPGFKA